MQVPGPHPRPTESETLGAGGQGPRDLFQQAFQVILVPLVFKNLWSTGYHSKNVKIFQGQNSQYWGEKTDNSATGITLLQRITELNHSINCPSFTKIRAIFQP